MRQPHQRSRHNIFLHRLWATITALGVALATLAIGSVLPGMPGGTARAAEYTSAQNNLRDGWDPNEPGLSPSRVRGSGFGRLFATKINGQVYAQPLVVGNTVIVATENDWVYGINSTAGNIIWSRHLGTPWPASAEHCTDLEPNIGVTSTPVYDPARKLVYLVAETVPQGNTTSNPVFHLVEMSPGTGAIVRQIHIAGAPVNGGLKFHPYNQLQRAGLLLTNGSVYAAFAGHCDFTPYTGYMAGINVTTGSVNFWSDESGINDTGAGIWAAGAGLMSDGRGRIFFATGNGTSPPQAAGTASSALTAFGDSVVRLGAGSGGTLSAKDFFSPADAPQLDAMDQDLGSGGPVGLPFGTKAFPDLLMEAGKGGIAYLLNRNSLGGRMQGANGTDNVVAEAGPFGGQYGRSAAFGTTASVPDNTTATNDYLYYVGKDDFLRVLRFGADASGKPTLSDVANTAFKFGYLSSGAPVVTSHGTNPASAVLWMIGMSDLSGRNGRLYAFRAVPAAGCTQAAQCTVNPIGSWPIGTANKFSVPATSNGRVYVGTRDGHLLAFGNPSTTPITAPGRAFPRTAVGRTVTRTVTLTAARRTTVTRIGTSNGFRVLAIRRPNGRQVRLPVRLARGWRLKVRVRFKPARQGQVNGIMTVATRSSNFPKVRVRLHGTGIRTGFYARPGRVNFGKVAVRFKRQATVRIFNGGTRAERVTSRHRPGGPFGIQGWPRYGTWIGAGKSIVLKITYAPHHAVRSLTSLSIAGPKGTRAVVRLAGTGLADRSRMSSPGSVSLGPVALGQSAERTITITNTGDLPATIRSVSPPRTPFGAPSPTAVTGLHLLPGNLVHIPLTFTPTSIGDAQSAYVLRWTDVRGHHTRTISLAGTGTAAPAGTTAIAPPGGGWTFNGSAGVAGTSVQLTPASSAKAGSAVYPVPEPANGIRASFTTAFSGGAGGGGLTFSLLNAGKSNDRSLGGPGALLGYGGLPGVAVTLDTIGGQSQAGIAASASGGSLNYLTHTAQNVPDLRTGTHTIQVAVSNGKITVTIDGKPVISSAVTLPSKVLLAFTAGTTTGAGADSHTVTGMAITAGGNPVPPPGGGWSFNASGHMSGADTVLTTTSPADQAGTVIYPTPVQTAGLNVTFQAQLSGKPSFGDYGLTFALLNPALGDTFVGGSGASQGFGSTNLAGTSTAVALVTGDRTGEAPEYVGITNGLSGSVLNYHRNQAYGIPELRTGPHTVNVRLTPVTGGMLFSISLDGVPVINQVMTSGVPATALLAFTGGTATQPDTHIVRNVAISARG